MKKIAAICASALLLAAALAPSALAAEAPDTSQVCCPTSVTRSADGSESYLQLDRGLEFLDAARMLRAYLKGESGSGPFSQTLYKPVEITAAQFHGMASLRMENTGKVTGAFEPDFDAQTMSALHIIDIPCL